MDGICSDFPEVTAEAIKEFRPDAGKSEAHDAPSIPPPGGNGAPAAPKNGNGRRKPDVGDLEAGGWYESPVSRPPEAEWPVHQRLLSVIYGDLGGVRDLLVCAIQESKLFLRACSFATAVREGLIGGGEEWKAVRALLHEMCRLCRAVEAEAEAVLRPIVASVESLLDTADPLSEVKVRSTRVSTPGHEARWLAYS